MKTVNGPSFEDELHPNLSIDIYRELAYSHAIEAGPYEADLVRLIRRDDVRGLVLYDLDYGRAECAINTPEERPRAANWVYHARQALAYFQKLSDLDIGIDKEQVALEGFLASEQRCAETNLYFRMVREGQLAFPTDVHIQLEHARNWISKVLGEIPDLTDLGYRFGPGGTRGCPRREASIHGKVVEKLQCSEELYPYAQALLGELPHLASVHSSLTRVDEDGDEWDSVDLELSCSRLNFVPKNAKTYRSIGAEPGLNVMFQLGIGDYMANRLAAFGLDIREQGPNQTLAQIGSLTGDLATLDLSSASDNISREIVAHLLPLDWYILLSRGRSGKIELPNGKIVQQQKFSSMGNGYTFPLETLIFWGLARSAVMATVGMTGLNQTRVYGDDIIVPVGADAELRRLLTYTGFVVNEKKSYSQGPFRESCGADWYFGFPVRPYYPRGWVSTQSLFVLHNFYVRRHDAVRARRVANLIHPAHRIYGPDGFGDGHLIGVGPRYLTEHHRDIGFSGYFFYSYVAVPNRAVREGNDRVETAVALYHTYQATRSAQPDGEAPFRHSMPRELSPGLPEEEGRKLLTFPGNLGFRKKRIYTLGD